MTEPKKTITFNSDRNEVLLPVRGVPRVMRATWKAMQAIETELGVALVPLLDKLEKGEFGFREVSTVLFHGLEANQDHRMSREDIGELIQEEGLTTFSPYAVMLLAVAFHGGKNVSKKFVVQQQKLLDELSGHPTGSTSKPLSL